MKRFFRSSVSRVVATGMAIAVTLLAAKLAHADFIITLTQQGSNVVATGSGQIDLTGLVRDPYRILSAVAGMIPYGGLIINGPVGFPPNDYDWYFLARGPQGFGLGMNLTYASTGSGDIVGIDGGGQGIIVPRGYVSDSPLSDTAT
jgi:uncharacterized oligopeptide transporter (OPT) family protein